MKPPLFVRAFHMDFKLCTYKSVYHRSEEASSQTRSSRYETSRTANCSYDRKAAQASSTTTSAASQHRAVVEDFSVDKKMEPTG